MACRTGRPCTGRLSYGGGSVFEAGAQGREVIYAASQWHASMFVPTATCSLCCTSTEMPPDTVLAFPSTPDRPSVFYSWDVLEEAVHTNMSAPYSTTAFCTARHRMHEARMAPGTSRPQHTVWRCFAPALDRFRACHLQLLRLTTLGLPGVSSTGLDCPACRNRCTALTIRRS